MQGAFFEKNKPNDIVMVSSSQLLSQPEWNNISEACSYLTAWVVVVYNVMAPIGSLIFGDPYPVKYSNIDFQIVFRFKPENRLGFNVTFVRLFVPQRKNSFVTISNSYFAGEYSSFDLFLNLPCFEIVVNINLNPLKEFSKRLKWWETFYIQHITLHHFEAVFVAMDKLFVDTNQYKYKAGQISFLTKLYIVQNILFIHTLYMKARKFQRLLLCRNMDPLSLVKLFDSPDSSCCGGIMAEDVQKCSTFQCFVEIFFQHNSIITVNYSATNITIDKQYTVNQRHLPVDIHLLLASCGNLCTSFIDGTEGNQINLTVKELVFSGPSHYLCRYGGMFHFEAYQQIPEIRPFYQSDVMCSNSSISSPVKRTLLSSNGSLFIAVFAYKGVSILNVTLTLKQTKCWVVRVCGCNKFKQYDAILCPNQPFADLVVIRKSDEPQISFNIQPNQCLVLTKDKIFFNQRTMCKLHIDPNKGLRFKSTMVFHVQGILDSLVSYFKKLSAIKCQENKQKSYKSNYFWFCDGLITKTSADPKLSQINSIGNPSLKIEGCQSRNGGPPCQQFSIFLDVNSCCKFIQKEHSYIYFFIWSLLKQLV